MEKARPSGLRAASQNEISRKKNLLLAEKSSPRGKKSYPRGKKFKPRGLRNLILDGRKNPVLAIRGPIQQLTPTITYI